MKTLLKAISTILALVMIFSLMPMQAFALETDELASTCETEGLFIKVGNTLLSVNTGDEYTYTAYLQVPSVRISSIEVALTYPSSGLTYMEPVDEYGDCDLEQIFPVLGSAVVYNSNLDSKILFNYSNISGKKFWKTDGVLFTGKFKVKATSGVLEINTTIKNLADNTMKIYIKNGESQSDNPVVFSQAAVLIEPPTEVPTHVLTEAPTQAPTEAPTQEPTEAPTQEPTEAPTQEPTEAPTQAPTDPPTEKPSIVPTETQPGLDGLFIRVDGAYYPVKKGQTYTYAFYLNTGVSVASIDASTYYDKDGLDLVLPLDEDDEFDDTQMFPICSSGCVSNTDADGEILFNASKISGYKFNADDKKLITADFTVTADSGVYDINTVLNVLATPEGDRIVYSGETIQPFFSKQVILGFYTSIAELPSDSKKPINILSVDNLFDEYYYIGQPIVPQISVSDGAKTLVKDIDYTVVCANNTKLGTAKITVFGIGDYSGAVEKQFSIVRKPIDECSIVGGETPEIFTGKEIKPAYVINDGENTLVQNTDYTIEYSNNVNAGDADVTIKGIGNYTSTAEKSFTIVPAPMSSVTKSAIELIYPHTGDEIKPAITLSYNGVALLQDTDYTIVYSDNIAPGEAKIEIEGKDNFAGEISYSFTVDRIPLDSAVVTNIEQKYWSTAAEITPQPIVTLGSDILTSGTDYTVRYENNILPGTATVIITGSGDYKGTLSKTFEIERKLDKISLTSLPTKTEYKEKTESFEPTGAVVRADYTDGYFENIDLTASMVTGFDNSIVGEQVLSVTYLNQSTSFKVNIKPMYKKGDADRDGEVTIMDVTCIQKYLSSSISIDEIEMSVADTDGDGDVSIIDATVIQKFLAKMIPTL